MYPSEAWRDDSQRKSLADSFCPSRSKCAYSLITPDSTDTNLSNTGVIRVGAEPTTTARGQEWPDAHIDLKVNHAWGYAALTGVIHDASATYYTAAGNPLSSAPCVSQPGTTFCGHPGDQMGWAVAFTSPSIAGWLLRGRLVDERLRTEAAVEW
jgi:hypothetical protein